MENLYRKLLKLLYTNKALRISFQLIHLVVITCLLVFGSSKVRLITIISLLNSVLGCYVLVKSNEDLLK